MADKTVDQLTELTTLEANDLLIAYDVSELGPEKIRKITKTNAFVGVGGGVTTEQLSTTSGVLNTKIDTTSGTLQSAINGKESSFSKNTAFNKNYGTTTDTVASGSHLHDDRYFTETELTNGQLDSRYYTESEVNTISGVLNNKINTVSGTSVNVIAAQYYQGTPQTIPTGSSGWIVVNFDTKIYDSNNAVTPGATWRFVCPTAGLYRVSSYISTASVAWNGGASYGIALSRQGQLVTSQMGYIWIPTNGAYTNQGTVWGTATANCDASDTLAVVMIQWRSGSTALTAGAGQTWVTIERIGNKIV
jgi:hypothetical protein